MDKKPSLAYRSLTIHYSYDEKLKEGEIGGTCGTHGSEMCAQLCHFMLPPRCKCDLRSFGIVGLHFRTDVSVQLIGPIFKDQAVQKDGTDRLSRNVGTDLLSYAA